MPRLIKFSCQGCGTKLAVPHEMAGLSDSCPKCGSLVTSPTLDEWEVIQSKVAAAKKKGLQSHASAQGWSSAELADALNPPATESVESKPAESLTRKNNPAPTVSSLLATSSDHTPEDPDIDPFKGSNSKSIDKAAPEFSQPQQAEASEPDSPSLLSRVLSVPPASASSHSPTRLVPVSKKEPASSPEVQPEHEAAADMPASSEQEDEKRKTLYSSPHSPGLGELLATVHTHQDKAGRDDHSLGRRKSPFIDPPVSTKLRKRKRRLIIIGFLLFLLADVAIVIAIYRHKFVEFLHTKVVRSVPAEAESPPVAPESRPDEDPILNIPAQRRPESASPAPTLLLEPDSEPVRDGVENSAPAPAIAEPGEPQADAAVPVPQAIPITEEQLVQMLKQQETSAVAEAAVIPESAPKIDLPPPPSPAPGMTTEITATETSSASIAPSLPVTVPDAASSNSSPVTPASLAAAPSLPVAPSLNGGNPALVEEVASPAPVASAPSTQKSPPVTNKIPAEAKAAFETVKNFLSAPDWRARSKWVLNSSRLTQAMEKDAQEFGDGPIHVGSIFFSEQYKGSGTPYYMFELEGGDLPHRVMAIALQPSKGQTLIDWESFNEFRRDKLLRFLENPGTPTGQFRVVLRRKHYFDKDVTDIDKKESFQVTQPNVSYEGNVFVSKSSSISTALATKLPWGMDILVIAELAWKKSAGHEWVEIQSIPHYGWRKP